MIKRLSILMSLMFSVVQMLCAQSLLSSQEMVSITPMVSTEIDLPSHAQKLLTQKMTQVVTQNGFGAVGGDLVLTANILVTDAQSTGGVPPMMIVNAEVSLVLVNLAEKVVVEEMALNVRGIEKSQDRALIKCVNMINPRHTDVRAFMKRCRSKVIDYYTTRIPAIIAKANSYAARTEYDQAIRVLAAVPESVDEYPAVADLLVSLYVDKLDYEAKPKMIEVKRLMVGDNYEEVMDILVTIDPNSSYYAEAERMIDDIKSKLEAEERARVEAELAKREAERLAAEQAAADKRAAAERKAVAAEKAAEREFELAKLEAAKSAALAISDNEELRESEAGSSMLATLNAWFTSYFK